jgi:hypothetical protein
MINCGSNGSASREKVFSWSGHKGKRQALRSWQWEKIGCIEFLALSCMGGANDGNVSSWRFRKRVGEIG